MGKVPRCVTARNYADYLKPCPYNNAGGPRLATYIKNVQSTIFRDLTPEQVLELHYKLLFTREPTRGMTYPLRKAAD